MTIGSNSLVVSDSKSPLNLFKKHGYYQVGNQAFNYKIRALQEATRTNQLAQWVFNDDVYSAMDWQTPLHLSLNEIYRIRAQQLRQKYDYLVLYFSGGADSTVALQSFVNNNIKLDEIVVGWPVSQSQGTYTPNFNDTSAHNMMSEWDYSIKPKLDWIAQYHPDIRITVCDILQTPKNNHFNEDLMTLVDNHSYIGINRNQEFDLVLRERTKTHPNIAGIAGTAPLECAVADGKYLVTYFIDSAINGFLKNDESKNDYVRNIEFFFWTPDFPELVREQSHVMMNYLNANPDAQTLLPHVKLKNQGLDFVYQPDAEFRRTLKKKVLYPSWKETLQVDKPGDVIGFSAWQGWWHNNRHSDEFVSSWESAVSSEISLIDIKYFWTRDQREKPHNLLSKSLMHNPSNNYVVGYASMISKFYPVGRLNSTNNHK
jgi:hypothetical protein